MRAAVMHAYGDPGVLVAEDVPDPVPTAEMVRVDLHASALNWHDCLVRQGLYGSPLPHVPGADGAGVRHDTGEEVIVAPSLWWGDRPQAPGPRWEILGDHRWGTLAESVLVPADVLLPRPSGWSWEQAAALPLVGMTVYRALVTRGRLRAGENLLVLGAGGGVATMATELAAALGAQVWVTHGSPEKLAHAVAAGARDAGSYREPDWAVTARAASPDGAGFDRMLDSVGSWPQALTTLRPGGRLVVLGAARSNDQLLQARPFYFGQFDLLGTAMGTTAELAAVLRLVEDGGLGPPAIAAAYDLDRASDAHRHLEAGQTIGKVVVRTR
ncbi:MAG: zinc-binding dehydrogenase [Tetrasphaera sp.]